MTVVAATDGLCGDVVVLNIGIAVKHVVAIAHHQRSHLLLFGRRLEGAVDTLGLGLLHLASHLYLLYSFACRIGGLQIDRQLFLLRDGTDAKSQYL